MIPTLNNNTWDFVWSAETLASILRLAEAQPFPLSSTQQHLNMASVVNPLAFRNFQTSYPYKTTHLHPTPETLVPGVFQQGVPLLPNWVQTPLPQTYCKKHNLLPVGLETVTHGTKRKLQDETLPPEDKDGRHTGQQVRMCKHVGCSKYAQGGTPFCVGHGGGKRCQHPGCKVSARGKSGFCIRHGGGKRCQVEGCKKSAIGSTRFCVRHGGGRRCIVEGCNKSAQGATDFCVRHGEGRKCKKEGCMNFAKPRANYCTEHLQTRKRCRAHDHSTV